MDINECLLKIKTEIERCISTGKNLDKVFDNGLLAKESFIRSSRLINYLHETVKNELVKKHIIIDNIFPPVGCSKPEVKLTGYFKCKKQDITVIPSNIKKEKTKITWGPLAHENIRDEYGARYTENCLVINVRSQLSSLAKNSDTLFERTIAEAINLHIMYPHIVLGEVYLIPVYQYDQEAAKNNKIKFCKRATNLEKYISFFKSVSERKDHGDGFKYERCALIIVDFSKDIPILYSTTKQLKKDHLVNKNFDVELKSISFQKFTADLLKQYSLRFNIHNIKR